MQLDACAGPCKEMILTVDMSEAESFEMRLMETGEECVLLTYEKQSGKLTIDRSASGYSLVKEGEKNKKTRATADVALMENTLSLRIFVDVSIMEVYANHGEKVMTCQAFPKGKDYGVSAAANGKAVIAHLESYDMA